MDAQANADSGSKAKAIDASVDAGKPPPKSPTPDGGEFMPSMRPGTPMPGSGACTSDAQCRSDVEGALRELSEAHAVRRRVVQATCTQNPCDLSRPRPVCGCVLAPDDGRPLEAYTLGSVGPCAVFGRGPTCLVRKKEYVACDTAVAGSCESQCEHVAEVLDADDERARRIEVRYAACMGADTGGACMTVVRIDDACYFEAFSWQTPNDTMAQPPVGDPGASDSQSYAYRVPEIATEMWDCSLTDSEIVSKYYPKTDCAALGCTVSETTIACPSQGNGGCYLPLCRDPACYPDAGLDAGGAACSCSNEDLPDFDAGRD